MHRLIHWSLFIICSVSGLSLNIYSAPVVSLDEPSVVTVDNNQLKVQRNDQPGSYPYTIKGVSWSPATGAPATGPDPLNRGSDISYGFFFQDNYTGFKGSELNEHWLGREFINRYMEDIPLLKEMNVNTVRVYSDFIDAFSEDPEEFRAVLDELYRNDIMILLTVAGAKNDLQPFSRSVKHVYSDNLAPSNLFSPSGWMGDTANISLDTNWGSYAHSGSSCIRFEYAGINWAGIYFQFPNGNWGDALNKIGHNLIGHNKLVFKARGQNGGEVIDNINVGGLAGDTVNVQIGPIVLSDEWQEFTVDLEGENLENVQGGFSFVVSGPQTVFFDQIHFGSFVYHERSAQYVYGEHAVYSPLFVPESPVGANGFATTVNPGFGVSQYKGAASVQINYSGTNANSWSGVHFKNIAGNDGSLPGVDLSANNKLIFMARGENGGEVISSVQVGNTSNDSATVSRTNIVLTDTWEQYVIDLEGADLTDIRSGFYIELSGQGNTVVYLDEIHFAQTVSGSYYKVIDEFKDHPAILGWTLGNEWNLNRAYGFDTLEEAASAFNAAAAVIKSMDPNHPVLSVLGDVFSEPLNPWNPWSVSSCVQLCPNIDLWGLNIYRGASFGSLFTQWQNVFTSLGQLVKPLFISEFGIDSYQSTSFSILPGTSHKAINVTGVESEALQAQVFSSLWTEIEGQLSETNPLLFCVGGSVHEFSDEWWKVGNFHAQMGDMVDYTDPIESQSYALQNNEGFILTSFPDNVINEEFFGIVRADRTPKQIFTNIQTAFAPEIITLTGVPSGETTPVASVNAVYTYAGIAGTSSEGHSLDYRFSWGDGSYSDWSSSLSASRVWLVEGSTEVRLEARCQLHQNIFAISDALIVTPFNATVMFTSEPEVWSSEVSPSWVWTVPAGISDIEGYWVSIDNTGAVFTENLNYMANSLSEGHHVFAIQVQFDGGKRNDVATYDFNIDVTPPEILSVVLNNDNPLSASVNIPVIVNHDNDSLGSGSGVSRVEYRIGNGAFAILSGNTITLPQIAGSHTITFKCLDYVGNESQEYTTEIYYLPSTDSTSLIQYATTAFEQNDIENSLLLSNLNIQQHSTTASLMQARLVRSPSGSEWNQYRQLADIGASHYLQAQIYRDQGDTLQAAYHCMNVIKLFGFSPSSASCRQLLYTLGSNIDFGDQQPLTLSGLAQNAMLGGQPINAIIYAQRCLELYGSDAGKGHAPLDSMPDVSLFDDHVLANAVSLSLGVEMLTLDGLGAGQLSLHSFLSVWNQFRFGQYQNGAAGPAPVIPLLMSFLSGLGTSIDLGDQSLTTLTDRTLNAFNSGEWLNAIIYAQHCINLYENQALAEQASLTQFPGTSDFNNYPALNQVGRCLSLKMQALVNLKMIESALIDAQYVFNHLYYSQYLDSQSSLVQVKNRVASLLLQGGQNIDFGNLQPATLSSKALDAYDGNQMINVLIYSGAVFDRYGSQARTQQASLSDFPPLNEVNNFQALNHVSYAYYLLGCSYFDKANWEMAYDYFQKCILEFGFAQIIGNSGTIERVSDLVMDKLDVFTQIGMEETPWSTGENGSLFINNYWNYTMGYHFRPVADGRISGLGGLFAGNKTVSVWNRTTGELLAQTMVTSDNQWSFVNIPPIDVRAGQDYTIAAYLSGIGGSCRTGVSSFPRTYGNIEIRASCYASGNQRPVNSSFSTMYGQVDFIFTPGPVSPPVNAAPVITSVPLSEVTDGELFMYQVTALDADLDTLIYSLTEAPAGMNIDSLSGLVTWNPQNSDVGFHAVTVNVSDQNGGDTTQSFVLEVIPVQIPGIEESPWSMNENGNLSTNLYWNYTMGYSFTPLTDGYITRLGGMFNGTRTIYLWNSSTGELLAQTDVSSSNIWGFTKIAPVPVTAGTQYTVAVYLRGTGGSFRSQVSPFPRTYGNITILGSRYAQGNQLPTAASTANMYGQVDVTFVPAG